MHDNPYVSALIFYTLLYNEALRWKSRGEVTSLSLIITDIPVNKSLPLTSWIHLKPKQRSWLPGSRHERAEPIRGEHWLWAWRGVHSSGACEYIDFSVRSQFGWTDVGVMRRWGLKVRACSSCGGCCVKVRARIRIVRSDVWMNHLKTSFDFNNNLCFNVEA